MANKKFSDFTSKTSPSDVSFVVGYDGSDNVRISPSNLLGAYLPLAGGTMSGNTIHGDNVKSLYGTGSDLQIYHDGSDSYVADTGTGDLKLQGTNLRLKTGDGSSTFLQALSGGSVSIYHNGSKKFETTSAGVSVTGSISITGDGSNATTLTESGSGDFDISTVDDLRLTSGGNDIVLRGASAAEFGRLSNDSNNLVIKNTTADKDIIFQTDDGSGGETAYLTLDGSTTHSYFSAGNVGIGTTAPTAKLQVVGLAEHADNSAATTAGLTAGAFYRTGDLLKVVH
tara:strand:+ start:2742 stop:3593 length:852 start_codon:yes stop_codon:yes gene_type:complete